ncbi:NAD(+) kinase, variant 2 [Orbilia oligospora]|nr:NAD(+) kinase [Orbilia oligospora]KAF3293650.1 NAD(+) kinase, variant 2 [Orbilia oligospora]
MMPPVVPLQFIQAGATATSGSVFATSNSEQQPSSSSSSSSSNNNSTCVLPQSILSPTSIPLPVTPKITLNCSASDGALDLELVGDIRSNPSSPDTVVAVPVDPLPISASAATTSTNNSTTPNNNNTPDEASKSDQAALLPRSKSFLQHRKGIKSVEVPRQRILEALIARQAGPLTANPMAAPGMKSPGLWAPSNLNLDTKGRSGFMALQSPCFYHQRFDPVIDVERVVDEIAHQDEMNMSHSDYLKTATSVREISRQLNRRTIKSAVQNVMIVTKARDNSLVVLTREVALWLMKTPRYGRPLGVNVYVDKKLKVSRRFDADGLIRENPELNGKLQYWTPDMCYSSPDTFDLVLTLGGDGTVLFTSWLFQAVVPPILSFSLGSLGFLTNFKFEEYKRHLDKVLNDGTRVSMRMRFTCTVFRAEPGESEPIEGERFEVLNELVIDRGPSPYVSHMELYGDDDHITTVAADGCIFSTPTGSTAYSLSAGGSLVHPDIPAILVTPICPHTLSFRPMILSDSMLLRVNIPEGSRATAWCSFDGRARLELRQGDYITIAASKYPFPTVLSQPQEWIDSIQRTLQWNKRAAAQKAFVKSSGDSELDLEDEWDIDTTDDSGIYTDDGDGSASSPMRRQMSLLTMA